MVQSSLIASKCFDAKMFDSVYLQKLNNYNYPPYNDSTSDEIKKRSIQQVDNIPGI